MFQCLLHDAHLHDKGKVACQAPLDVRVPLVTGGRQVKRKCSFHLNVCFPLTFIKPLAAKAGYLSVDEQLELRLLCVEEDDVLEDDRDKA